LEKGQGRRDRAPDRGTVDGVGCASVKERCRGCRQREENGE
jgi:hypothetical protein